MQFSPNDAAAQVTEVVMSALRKADVLKPDEPDHPHNYNHAFEAVYQALTTQGKLEKAAAVPSRRVFDKAIVKNLSYLNGKGLMKV